VTVLKSIRPPLLNHKRFVRIKMFPDGHLESGNENHGFRYFMPGSAVTADLAYAIEGVDALMQSTGPQIEALNTNNSAPMVAKVILVVGKPTKRT
jgi:hypothetical protein